MTTLTQKFHWNPRLSLLALALGIICVALLAVHLWQNRTDAKARYALDSMLSESKAEWQAPDWFSSINPAHPFLSSPADRYFQHVLDEMNQDFINMPVDFPKINQIQIQSPSIQIRENPDVYIVEVPVNKPSDANNVQITVNPHFIQVSGQVTQQNGNTFYSTSSFMKSFTTTAELDANRVEKKIQVNKLTITIPKKQGEASSTVKPLPALPTANFI